MVDTTDLKSVDLIGREGSSPSTPNICVKKGYKNLTGFIRNRKSKVNVKIKKFPAIKVVL